MKAFLLTLAAGAALAQIDTSIIEKHREALRKQAADPEWARKGGTQPQDWPYQLPEGVTTRQVVFYSDGTACHAKLFLPKGFAATGKTPGVVLGHGFNAISIGIEKYGARFAERGLVAMVIDYRTYGFSSGQPRLLEPDPSNDSKPVWEKTIRVQLKRTRLHHARQIEDYRAAISFLQGEPGVDRDRIGIWGSSNSGAEVITIAGLDSRVKAVVAQVSGVGGRNATGPAPLPPNLAQDAILRATTGQGGEADGGFSFRTKIDVETQQAGREHRPWAALDRIPQTTAILWLPAEKDELIPPKGASGPFEAQKAFQGIGQVVEVPGITHFQAYSGAAFEVTSNLAADWFLKYLPAAVPAPETPLPQPVPARPAPAMFKRMPANIEVKDIRYFSEGVECHGKLYLPKPLPEGKLPAVVVAPGWGETQDAVAREAAELASAGVIALAIDYRGWGKSGAYIYVKESVRQDDRFRFLQVTAPVELRRKRLLPRDQVDDIRNAISFLSGEAAVDPSRISVWGFGLSAGHAFATAAVDARVKAVLATSPLIPGAGVPAKAQRPSGPLAEEAIRLARTGRGPDSQVALADYFPFHSLSQIPETTAVLIGGDEAGVRAAVQQIKAKSEVHRKFTAAEAAAWLRSAK